MPSPTGTMEYSYQGTNPAELVEVSRTVRPQPTDEEDLDRFWDQVMKPAILEAFSTNPPASS